MNRLAERLMLTSFFFVVATSGVDAKRPNVMDATLPTGTIIGLEPDLPTLPVELSFSGGMLIIEGQLDPATGAITANTQDWNLCSSQAATCRKFDANLPSNHVINGEFEYYARLKGQSEWIPLGKRVVGARFIGTYEDFGGFSAAPYFASANCAVSSHDETAWEVRNWTGQPVEFQIRIPTKACAAIVEREEPAD